MNYFYLPRYPAGELVFVDTELHWMIGPLGANTPHKNSFTLASCTQFSAVRWAHLAQWLLNWFVRAAHLKCWAVQPRQRRFRIHCVCSRSCPKSLRPQWTSGVVNRRKLSKNWCSVKLGNYTYNTILYWQMHTKLYNINICRPSFVGVVPIGFTIGYILYVWQEFAR